MNLRVGICHFYLRQYIEAEPYLDMAKELDEIEAYYYLGQVYHLEGLLDEEIQAYQYYKNHPDQTEQPIENVNRLLDRAKFAKIMIVTPTEFD